MFSEIRDHYLKKRVLEYLAKKKEADFSEIIEWLRWLGYKSVHPNKVLGILRILMSNGEVVGRKIASEDGHKTFYRIKNLGKVKSFLEKSTASQTTIGHALSFIHNMELERKRKKELERKRKKELERKRKKELERKRKKELERKRKKEGEEVAKEGEEVAKEGEEVAKEGEEVAKDGGAPPEVDKLEG
jgi:hypothetical protein